MSADIDECKYLVLAYSEMNGNSEYFFATNKKELKRICEDLKQNHFEIMFAGKIDVTEDYTKSMM